MALGDIERVLTFPVAAGAVPRLAPAGTCPASRCVAANSNAEAARLVGEEADGRSAAVAPALAAKIYGLDVLATDIEDHPENETRFVLVGRDARARRPPATTRPRSWCSSAPTRPARSWPSSRSSRPASINLTKLESRPTKKQLGDYCFVIDLEGHLADEVVADCLRDLRSKVADIKFLGSYPAAGAARRRGPPRGRGVLASRRRLALRPPLQAPAADPGSVAAGAVAEWTKATALKVVDPQGSVGSNPTRSAVVDRLARPRSGGRVRLKAHPC